MLPVFSSLAVLANQAGFQLRKHAPQIMIIGGIVGGATATVLACRATIKAKPVIEEAKSEVDEIRTARNEGLEGYTDKDARKDLAKVNARTALEIAKIYAIPAAIGAASVASILGGTGILNKRNAGLAIAASSSALEVKKLKDGLVKEYGEEKGKELANKFIYGIEETEEKEKITDENGKTKTVKKLKKKVDGEQNPISYVRQFDWTNPYYTDDMNYNLFFLRAKQAIFNDMLKAHGHLFMNDADGELGFDKSKAGQIVGWNYDLNNPYIDNFVDLNLVEAEAPYEYFDRDGESHIVMKPVILIEYNVDGSILNDVDWEKQGGRNE